MHRRYRRHRAPLMERTRAAVLVLRVRASDLESLAHAPAVGRGRRGRAVRARPRPLVTKVRGADASRGAAAGIMLYKKSLASWRCAR